MIPLWPHSPPPAEWNYEPRWMSEDNLYETGMAQFSTLFVRPLFNYEFSYRNAQETRQSQIESLWNATRGHTGAFFFQDPRSTHHYSNSAATGFFVTSRQGRFYTNANCWRVIPASGQFTLYSALSGALTNGVHFAFSQDNGFFSVFTTALNSSDTYGWQGNYFRKCHFERTFNPRGRMWQNFDFTVSFYEVLPDA